MLSAAVSRKADAAEPQGSRSPPSGNGSCGRGETGGRDGRTENAGGRRASEQVSGHISPTSWLSDGTGRATAEATHTFARPGTCFAVAKIATNRTPGDAFTRVRNQARMRVVVSE